MLRLETTEQVQRAPRAGARLIIALAGGLLLGAGLAAFSTGEFLPGWLAASVLLIPALFLLVWAWSWAGGGKTLAAMIAAAFFLRLAVGVGLSLALPQYGYPNEPEQQAGYLFFDAYNRDLQAWELAGSDKHLASTFGEEFVTDQYGGLLALSGLVYRYLSPDAHRPFLILVLSSFTVALGLPFLYRAARLRWSMRAAVVAGWVYALYPDGVFFSASQLREPFLIGLACLAFYAVIDWSWRSPRSWLLILSSLAGMALISNRVTAAVAGLLGLLFLLEHIVGRSGRRWQIIGWVSLAVGALLVLGYSWEWFRSSAAWDFKETTLDAGRVAYAIDEASQILGVSRDYLVAPIITVYGLFRPVLPAAVIENAQSGLWKGIGIFRSAGWYALAPFLIYALFSVWREADPRKRRRAVWLALAVFAWIIIASARGGGDATDNPRYRTLFLPWMALLAGWAVNWAVTRKDAWLWRWAAVEVIFVGFFTQWYVSRYFRIWGRLPFWLMVVLIVVLSAAVLVGGWLYDRRKAARAAESRAEIRNESRVDSRTESRPENPVG